MQSLCVTTSFDHVDYSSDIRIGFSEGVSMVGVIDEVWFSLTENDRNPILIGTKTRSRDNLPTEPYEEMEVSLILLPFHFITLDMK